MWFKIDRNLISEESKRPTSSGWPKARIIDWLVEKGEDRAAMQKMIIPELVKRSKIYKSTPDYKVPNLYYTLL